MQKKLLTLAVAGALGAPGVALAQASVEVYGTVNMSFGSVKWGSGTQGAPSLNKWDVANHASNYGFRGRESVGGGMTAWFQIEQNAPLERSNNIAITPASRNSAVGLQADWGNVFVGQWTTPWADLDSLWSIGTVGGWGPVTSIIGRRETTGTAPNANCVNIPTSGGVTPGTAGGNVPCDAIEAGGGVGHPFWRRVSNAAFYQSPVFNGIQAKVAYQTNEGRSVTNATLVSVVSNASMWSTSVQWTGMGGNARIGAAYDRHSDFTTVNRADTGFAVKGGYNFGVVDLGFALETMVYRTAAGDCKGKNYAVAAAFPVATGAIRASYSVAGDLNDVGCGVAGVTAISPAGSLAGDNGATEFNLGYEHRFSKRTQIGVGYATIRNDALGAHNWTGLPPNQGGAVNAPPRGASISTWFFNMIHRF